MSDFLLVALCLAIGVVLTTTGLLLRLVAREMRRSPESPAAAPRHPDFEVTLHAPPEVVGDHVRKMSDHHHRGSRA